MKKKLYLFGLIILCTILCTAADTSSTKTLIDAVKESTDNKTVGLSQVLKNFKGDVNKKNKNGETALSTAISQGDGVVDKLLSSTFDFSPSILIPDQYKKTPIEAAVNKKKEKLASKLIDYYLKKKQDLNSKRNLLESIIKTSYALDLALNKSVLNKIDFSPAITIFDNKKPLLQQALEAKKDDSALKLIEYVVSKKESQAIKNLTQAKDKNTNNTFLHLAAQNLTDPTKVINALLATLNTPKKQQDALQAKNTNKQTPLDLMSKVNKTALQKQYGIVIKKEEKEEKEKKEKKADQEIINKLFNSAKTSTPNVLSGILMNAQNNKQLLKKGFKHKDQGGKYLMHHIIENQNLSFIKSCIKALGTAEIDISTVINFKDNTQKTPLMKLMECWKTAPKDVPDEDVDDDNDCNNKLCKNNIIEIAKMLAPHTQLKNKENDFKIYNALAQEIKKETEETLKKTKEENDKKDIEKELENIKLLIKGINDSKMGKVPPNQKTKKTPLIEKEKKTEKLKQQTEEKRKQTEMEQKLESFAQALAELAKD